MVFNRRDLSGETRLYMRTRDNSADPWGEPTVVDTPGFEDANGNNVWGEPSFDRTESFMIFTRFDTSDPNCYVPKLMYSEGDVTEGFSPPVVLN